jgi:hypothetical protein
MPAFATSEEVAMMKHVFLGMMTLSAFSVAAMDFWFAGVESAALMWWGMTWQHYLLVSATSIIVIWGFAIESLTQQKHNRAWIKNLRVFFMVWTLIGISNIVSTTTKCSEVMSIYLHVSLIMKLIVTCVV